MDPTKALEDFRRYARQSRKHDPTTTAHRDNLAMAVSAAEALDDWLTSGGFRPTAWDQQRESLVCEGHPDKFGTPKFCPDDDCAIYAVREG